MGPTTCIVCHTSASFITVEVLKPFFGTISTVLYRVGGRLQPSSTLAYSLKSTAFPNCAIVLGGVAACSLHRLHLLQSTVYSQELNLTVM